LRAQLSKTAYGYRGEVLKQDFFVAQTTRSIWRGQVIWITPLHPEEQKHRSTLDIPSTYIIKTVLLGFCSFSAAPVVKYDEN